MANDQLERDLQSVKYQLNLHFFAQAEILVRMKQPDISTEDLEGAIRAEENRLKEDFRNRPAEEMKGPGIRLL